MYSKFSKTIYGLLLFLILTTGYIIAQDLNNYPDYLAIGEERLIAEQTAMIVLLSWGGINALVGSGIAFEGAYRNFGLMTAGWGIINAGIATFALLNSDFYTMETSFATIMNDEAFFNRILAINTGLNVAYITAGSAMSYWGKTSRTRQFGSAVIIQGAFLLAFDSVLLYNSTDRMKRLSAKVDVVTLHSDLNSIKDYPILTLQIRF